MCGRYASTKDPATLASEFDAVEATGVTEPAADFNVAPTKDVFAVVERHPRDAGGARDPERIERSIRSMRWGLVPHWAKDVSIGNRMINARAESVTSKPAFRGVFKRRRCLLPADGWYEWRGESGRKQPYFMTPPGGASLALAGIWSTWHDPRAAEDASPLVTCSVLTTAAVGQLTTVHPRMPLALPGQVWARWLDPDVEDVAELLAPSTELVESLELRPVSTAVNKVANNGARLVERVPDAAVPDPQHPVGLDRAGGESG